MEFASTIDRAGVKYLIECNMEFLESEFVCVISAFKNFRGLY
jgi:hypothetical protein